MAFFAVLTLVPSTIAVGSALGFSEQLVGAGVVAKAEQAASDAVRVLMGPQLADNVITPFVHAQLTQPHRDVALGALLIAWWLSSHLFMATSHALDDCYGVRDHRPTFVQRFIALAFGLASVAVVAVTAEMMVSGPLGELTGDPARTLGIEGAYRGVWSIVRWPIGFALVVGFLICLYRFSANVRHHWRDCLPGAVVGAVPVDLRRGRLPPDRGRARLERGRQQRPVGHPDRPGGQRGRLDRAVGVPRQHRDPARRRAERGAAGATRRAGPEREVLREAVGGGAVLRRADALAQVGEDVAQQHVVLARRLGAAERVARPRPGVGLGHEPARVLWPARNSVVPRASPV